MKKMGEAVKPPFQFLDNPYWNCVFLVRKSKRNDVLFSVHKKVRLISRLMVKRKTIQQKRSTCWP